MRSLLIGCVVAAVVLSTTGRSIAEISLPRNPRFSPLADEVYGQEVSRRIESREPIWSVAVGKDGVYLGGPRGISRIDGDRLVSAGGPTGPVRRLRVLQGELWAAGDAGLWRYAEGRWGLIDERPCVDICLHRDRLVYATADQLYRHDGSPDSGSKAVGLIGGGAAAPILGVASHADTLYVRHRDRLGLVEQDRLEYYSVQDWGSLPLGSQTRDMLPLGDRLVVATDKGLAALCGMSWSHVTGSERRRIGTNGGSTSGVRRGWGLFTT